MKYLTSTNLNELCKGASLLGSGGGGDPAILKDYLNYLMGKNGPIEIVTVDDLDENSLVVPTALIGAPLVSLERIPNSRMFSSLMACIARDFPKKKIILMPAEIGGCNALTPFIFASLFSLPVLDADLIGRAFPKVSMCKPAINLMKKQVAYITSVLGEYTFVSGKNMDELEAKIRQVTLEYGCSALIGAFLFEGRDADYYVIKGSISRALQLGVAADCLPSFVVSGVITNVLHSIDNGFLKGHALIQSGLDNYYVHFQNEYLAIMKNNILIHSSPTIISILELSSQQPVASESLRYGLKVGILCLDAPEFWQSGVAKSKVELDAFELI